MPEFKLPPIKTPKVDTSRIAAGFKKISKAVNSYLNGKVSNQFFSHPAVRWTLAAILVIYIGVGFLVGWKAYKVKSESLNVRRILSIYPLPAVLMPQDIILVRDYLDQLSYIRHFAEKTKEPLPSDNELRAQLINQAIETRLLLRANQRYGARVTKGDIDQVYSKIAENNGGPQELKKLLTDLYGMEEKNFRLVIRDQLLREKIKKDVLVQIQAKHILIVDEKKAKEVLDQVKKEPAKFDELAKQHSQDVNNREKGGDLGYFGRGVMQKPFEEMAFKLNKGDIASELVKTEFGYHIIQIVDRKGKVDKTYEDFVKELRSSKKVWIVYK